MLLAPRANNAVTTTSSAANSSVSTTPAPGCWPPALASRSPANHMTTSASARVAALAFQSAPAVRHVDGVTGAARSATAVANHRSASASTTPGSTSDVPSRGTATAVYIVSAATKEN